VRKQKNKKARWGNEKGNIQTVRHQKETRKDGRQNDAREIQPEQGRNAGSLLEKLAGG
jgi:hypothetical protein